MARVYTQKAGKDYPAEGIRKGDTYYSWAFYRQKPRRSRTYPSRAQLTQNDFLVSVYTAFDVSLPAIESADDLRGVAAEIRDAGEELRGRFDELPEGFQQGDNGQEMERRADAADECADTIDSVADDLEERLTIVDAWESWLAARPDGQENCDDIVDQPEGVSDDDWNAWVEARPEDEPEHDREETLQAARDDCDEVDW